MKIGDTLQNGATVLAYAFNDAGDQGVVLAFHPAGSPGDPFITWAVDAGGFTYAGAYFNTVDGALGSFHARAGSWTRHGALNHLTREVSA